MPAMWNRLDEVVSIAPTLGEPDLIAYECPNCVYVTSELLRRASNIESRRGGPSLDENCSQGEFDTRVVKHPEHGTIELVPAEGQANFSKDNVRSKCDGKKVKGINIVYQSSPEYPGPDNADVMTFGSNGLAVETHWRLNVVR